MNGMKSIWRRVFLMAALTGASVSVNAASGLPRSVDVSPPDKARVDEIERLVVPAPTFFGASISDRAAWAKAAADPSAADAVRRAEETAKTPIPDFGRELFMQFGQNGNRSNWERVNSRRLSRVPYLMLGECIENKGRFLAPLEEMLLSICDQPTWLLSACDGDLVNLKGERIDIDLGAAMTGWNMATVLRVMEDKLTPATRERLRTELERRIFAPYKNMVTGKERGHWWFHGKNNWNAVCLGGVTGAALAVIESPAERAFYIASAEKYISYFLESFPPDGYCTEGLGYWNYGYGHFVMLTEAIFRATDGKIDFLKLPGAALPGEFGARFEIINNQYPIFADCSPNARPNRSYMYYIDRRLGLGIPRWAAPDSAISGRVMYEGMLFAFPSSATAVPPAKPRENFPGIRTYFDQVGILISRPGANGPKDFAVALKGGSNGEVHNHNDVGTFIVVSGNGTPICDPGSETYTARTFSKDRYASKVLNSFGHGVPRVAGQLQRTGEAAKARVVKTDFTDAADTFVIDIRSAYDVPELTKLERSFVYARAGRGSLVVSDEVEFASPEAFETALVSYGDFERQGPAAFEIVDMEGAVLVEVDTGGAAFEIETVEIDEDVHAPTKPTRIAVRLRDRVEKARVTMKISPAVVPVTLGGGGLLFNGGFEKKGRGWRIPNDKISMLVQEPVASGEYALRIADDQDKAGSNVRSGKAAVEGGKKYVLRGKVYPISGEAGIGMYVNYLDENGKVLNARDAKGGYPAVGSLGGTEKAWKDFAFEFETPPDTVAVEIWIHSYNGARGEAVLDDLELVDAGSK